jgi:hypothetical protein
MLSSSLDVAYQLFEVRTGIPGLKTIHRLGRAPKGTVDSVKEEFADVLVKMRGPDGARKRQNAERIRDTLISTVQEGGQARQALVNLLDDLGF